MTASEAETPRPAVSRVADPTPDAAPVSVANTVSGANGVAVLRRFMELADQVAPETSGHDGYRFTLGYNLQSDRDAASEVLSLVEHTPWAALLRAMEGHDA